MSGKLPMLSRVTLLEVYFSEEAKKAGQWLYDQETVTYSSNLPPNCQANRVMYDRDVGYLVGFHGAETSEEVAMAMWHAGRRNVYELDAWQKVDEFSTLLDAMCQELDLDHDKEWLLYLLTQAGRLMRQTVEEGWNREYLAECILSISEALTLLALVDYYLVFLRHEGYLTVARADELTRKLSDVQDTLTTLAGRLRAALRTRPEDPLAASPWSRN